MKRQQLRFDKSFSVVAENKRSQAAIMVLDPGKSEGDAQNKHEDSDQWLFVVAGEGLAIVKGKRLSLKKGTLLLIERGETHEIRNTGKRSLETLNFYVPPEY
ncbi:MAG: cupin domain-containing protein [Gemmatimonadaceae bacterium]